MNDYLPNLIKQFKLYKMLGERTFEQLPNDKLFWTYNEATNSIGTIVKHLHGNMMSRFTDFLTTDGEKTWRKRDEEFENDIKDKNEMLSKWEEGWSCVFGAIESLTSEDLDREVFIRNMGHSVAEALNRQLAHYAYHVGQIVHIGKMIQGEAWQSLSIPKGASKAYNQRKFSQPKRQGHFTDELIDPESNH